MTQAMVALAMLLACAAPCTGAFVRGSGAQHQHRVSAAAHMRPDVVARTLAQVGDAWTEEVMQFFDCNDTAKTSSDAKACENKDFKKSCPTVVNAIVQASNGDKSVVVEYMGDVCNERALQGSHHGQCEVLAAALADKMTSDSYDNRERMDTDRFCQEFFARLSVEERERMGQERLARLESKEQDAKKVVESADKKEVAAKPAAKPADDEAEKVIAEAEKEVADAKHEVKTVKVVNVSKAINASKTNSTQKRRTLCMGAVSVTYNTPPSSDYTEMTTESGECFKNPGTENIKICGFATLEATTEMDCGSGMQKVEMTSNHTIADCQTISSSDPYFNAFKYTCPY